MEKIEIKGCGYVQKQFGINVLSAEDFINIVAVATDLRRKPRRTASLTPHHRLNDFSDVQWFTIFHKKRRQPFSYNLLYPKAPPRTIATNKQKQPTPKGANNALAYLVAKQLADFTDRESEYKTQYISIIILPSF
ncbi:MAG: hypothetical protein IKN94_10715 [Salinivirgaceae bacterium]|nr:hypothetical protein [Salinivirgaceae bacterium]